MPSIASSVSNVPHSRIRELAEIAMSMDGVLRLYFGESNLPTPDYIKQAAVRAMNEGYTFYTENAGLPSLRRALADYYGRLQSVELDPAREIVVTASGVQALNLGIRCALDPGDEAIVLTPPIQMPLEYAVEFIAEDELVEVTPQSIRLRKRHLKAHDRKRASREETLPV